MLKLIRLVRRDCYKVARVLGNIQPWVMLSPKRIIRRQVYRYLGKGFSRHLFGGHTSVGKLIRVMLGI